MGIVHAKDYERSHFTIPHKREPVNDPAPSLSEVDFNKVSARVDRVHVNGLGRTKDDIVEDAVRNLFQASNFKDVLIATQQVKTRLSSLGCFNDIKVFIDVSRGTNSTSDGLEVTFDVVELKRIMGGIATQAGNNEGSLVVGLKAPNLLGRGERLQTEYSYGTKRSINFNVAFIKPFMGKYSPVFSTSVYQSNSEWPASGYKQLDRGLTLDFGFKWMHAFKHNIQWDGTIRDLSVIGKQTSFEVREQSGLSLKSAVRHILTADNRDEAIFPNSGNLLRITTELAGLGGNVGFVKNEFFFQQNHSIIEDFVFQTSLSGGIINPLNDEKKITMSDIYYLGGPLSVRGFDVRGIGTHVDRNALGSTWCWSGAAHLYTPLPFRPGKGGFGELFRFHMFANVGNIGSTQNNSGCISCAEIFNNVRMAYGLGIAVRLGSIAQFEINYCVPFLYQKMDCLHPGIQFGVGMNFL